MKTNIGRLRKDVEWCFLSGPTYFEFNKSGFLLMNPGHVGGFVGTKKDKGFRITHSSSVRYFIFGNHQQVFGAISNEIALCEEYVRQSAYNGDSTNYALVRENYRTRTHLRKLSRLERMANKRLSAIFNK